jgi:hypothetical protein
MIIMKLDQKLSPSIGTFLAAAATLVIATQVRAGEEKKTHEPPKKPGKGECHGVNSCKGKGECGGPGWDCAGNNACKGQGWITTTASDCKKKGGKFVNNS